MKNLFKSIAVFLCLAVILPLSAQTADNTEDDNDSEDDWIVVEGEGLTIVGTEKTTQQMETVDSKTIQKTAAPDVPSLLEEAAGLNVTRYGPYGNNAGINLRGFDTKRVAILVDGVPVNSASSGDFDFYSIDPLSIDRIEIIQGGSDTKYNVSGALGGVINIITVKKQNPGWSLGGSLSNTSYIPGFYNKYGGGIGNPQLQDLADTQNINLSGSYTTGLFSFGLNIFGNRAGNHFLFRDYDGFTRRREGNEILDAGTNLSFLWNIDSLSKLIATGSFYYGDKNIPFTGYATNYGKQNDISSRENLMLDMPRIFSDDFSMELSLGHNWKRLAYDPSVSLGINSSGHNEQDINFINRWSWYPGSALTMRLGGDYRFIGIDSTTTGTHYANRGGLYLTTELTLFKNLLLVASVKGITDGRDIVPIPKLGWTLTGSPSADTSIALKNNYYRSFKFPDFDDLYWDEGDFKGNPDLINEDGWGTDFGVDFSLSDWLKLSSVTYVGLTVNSIHWTYTTTWRPENSGAAAILGWDNNVDLTLPITALIFEKPILSLSWMFQPSRLFLSDGCFPFSDSRQIPYMPLHTVTASLELPWLTSRNKLPGSVTVSGRFESSRYTDTQNTTLLDPVFLLNIAYNQKVHKNIGVFGKITNALNASYVSFSDYPMPGINITLGLNFNIEGTNP
ncbi:MAG: TonB-dependent receptor plug domain-containing protein [Treponema sp.]|nr:TonB-dependent receptor plug domain-containing protein [Treponema sp.]